MSIKNAIRNVLNIRRERALPPAGPKPQIGSSIVRDRLRIRLKYHVTTEQWEWFVSRGWRTVDMRTNRREYTNVPDKVLLKLLDLEGDDREILHQRLFKKADAAKAERETKSAKATAVKVTKPEPAPSPVHDRMAETIV